MKHVKHILFFTLMFTCFEASEKEAVYCIHGYMRSPRSMKYMAKALESAGYEPRLWGYPGRDKFIEEHSEALAQELRQYSLEHPGVPIHFVTHSLGGIIVRAALNNPNCPEEAKMGRAILLAPPNQGSQFARYLHRYILVRKIMGQRSGKQLLVTKDFEHLGPFPSYMPVLVIAGTSSLNPTLDEPNDGKVTVAESALTTPHTLIEVDSGHAWIMSSGKVIEETLKFLQND